MSKINFNYTLFSVINSYFARNNNNIYTQKGMLESRIQNCFEAPALDIFNSLLNSVHHLPFSLFRNKIKHADTKSKNFMTVVCIDISSFYF